MEIEWLAIEKVVAGMIQALAAGAVVLPLPRALLGARANPGLYPPPRFLPAPPIASFLPPMEIEWLAIEKLVAGMIQALAAGLVVIPLARLIMGPGTNLSFDAPLRFLAVSLIVSCLAAAIGLTLGCSVGQTQIGLMFS